MISVQQFRRYVRSVLPREAFSDRDLKAALLSVMTFDETKHPRGSVKRDRLGRVNKGEFAPKGQGGRQPQGQQPQRPQGQPRQQGQPQQQQDAAGQYVQHAMRNLQATSRTASGQGVDTSASAGKAANIAEGLTGDRAKQQALANFQTTIKELYKRRGVKFSNPGQLLQFTDTVARTINRGITKEGVLLRTDNSSKFPYTAIEDLSAARTQFAREFLARLNDPKADPIETAGWLEWRANLTDHFWADGVGKTVKALGAWVLMRAGHPLPTYGSAKEMFDNAPKTRKDPHQPTSYYGEDYQKWQKYYRSLFGKAGAEESVSAKTERRAKENYGSLRDAYLKKGGGSYDAEGNLTGITLNTDDWRELFPEYHGTNASDVHKASSHLNKTLFAEALETMKGKGNNTMVIMAGGGGSGKGSVGRYMDLNQYPIRLDQVSDELEKLVGKMNEAKKAGFKIDYVFVDRPPEAAWLGGVVKRAIESRKKGENARTVPIEIALKANIEARKAAIELYKSDPRIPVQVVDNSRGFEHTRLITNRGAAIQHLSQQVHDYPKILERMKRETLRLYRQGKIPEDIARGLIGDAAIDAGRLQARHGQGNPAGTNESSAKGGMGGTGAQAQRPGLRTNHGGSQGNGRGSASASAGGAVMSTWDESQHPRGQPENAGEFAKTPIRAKTDRSFKGTAKRTGQALGRKAVHVAEHFKPSNVLAGLQAVVAKARAAPATVSWSLQHPSRAAQQAWAGAKDKYIALEDRYGRAGTLALTGAYLASWGLWAWNPALGAIVAPEPAAQLVGIAEGILSLSKSVRARRRLKRIQAQRQKVEMSALEAFDPVEAAKAIADVFADVPGSEKIDLDELAQTIAEMHAAGVMGDEQVEMSVGDDMFSNVSFYSQLKAEIQLQMSGWTPEDEAKHPRDEEGK